MDQLLANFHFIRPWWLLALVPALALFALLWRLEGMTSAWDRAIDRNLLPYLLDRSKSASQRLPLLLLAGAWAVTVLALAGPTWKQMPQPVQQRQDALVIVLDLSLSMFATDYEPNRLTVSKRKLRDVLSRREEGQTALVVYAGDAHTVTPLTDDTETIAAMVPALSPNIMPAFGSDPVAALERGQALLQAAGVIDARMLLVTDGVDRSQHDAIEELLRGSSYELAIIGVGTEEGAPIPATQGEFLRDDNGQVVIPALDRDSLRSLARSTGGNYRDIELSSDDIDYLLSDEAIRDNENLRQSDENFDTWYDAGPWLLLFLLPMGALLFRRGWLLSVALGSTAAVTLLTPTAPAQALEWEDLWKTPDQQGAQRLDEDPLAAAERFENPEWKGVAHYRGNDFAAAVEHFNQATVADDGGADDFYNLGNALAHAGEYETALQSYQAALNLESDHEDALHNKEIVEQLLEQQEQEQEQEQEESEEGEEEEEQDQQAQSEPGDEQQQQGDQQEQEEEPSEADEEEQEGEEQEQEQEGSESEEEGAESDNAQQGQAGQSEEQQSLEQWLRRIEDDPGELLQRKFRYQYRRRQLEGGGEAEPPGGQIW